MNDDTNLIENKKTGLVVIHEPGRRRLIVRYPDGMKARILEVIESLCADEEEPGDGEVQ